ncbi:HopJ type III effector protein [Thiomicrorhabdus chilensis]|uniref:HopJ type III effector protein n=1 Tax=Thiomicrorhabdus chilensis TaxID=63656 RepID=UPI00040E6EFF|nr:HopJ type III effector protein [Thiomicrorhabdus chilensis]
MEYLTTDSLIKALNQGPVDFKIVMQVIENEYEFSPVRFVNGDTVNEANTNNGSCKIFAFAKMHGLTEQATLNAFGDYYTKDVLQHPEKEDHLNIRNFIRSGWKGVQFEGEALLKK